MDDEILKVKMRNNRIEVVIWEAADYEIVKRQLLSRLDKMSHFLTKGCPKMLIAGKDFSEGQKRELMGIIKTDYNVSDVDFITLEHLERIHLKQELQGETEQHLAESASLFKQGKVCAGTVLEATGDMTVIGDVEPGAELIAGGNICVLGALRGKATAGANKKGDYIIVANILEASRLCICDCVGIAPKDNNSIGAPEYAHVVENVIVIEAVDNDSTFENDEKQKGIIGSLKRFFTYDH